MDKETKDIPSSGEASRLPVHGAVTPLLTGELKVGGTTFRKGVSIASAQGCIDRWINRYLVEPQTYFSTDGCPKHHGQSWTTTIFANTIAPKKECPICKEGEPAAPPPVEREMVERDAARYRWLRGHVNATSGPTVHDSWDGQGMVLHSESLDAAIDAAITPSQGEG